MENSASDLVAAAGEGGIQFDPLQSVSEWAESNITLTSIDASEPGPFRTARTPYTKEIMDCLSSEHPCRRVIWMAASQIAKTVTGLNWIGSVIDNTPGPMLMVVPTGDTAKRVSKQRLAPMIAASPALRAKVLPVRSRDSSNTLMQKDFPGGTLMLAGANSAAALRSTPVRFLYIDEIDNFPWDVDGEGDPAKLAERRTIAFARRKIFITSSPLLKGYSAIEREFERTDKRYYFVPCPECGAMQRLIWRTDKGVYRIVWTDHDHTQAGYVCEECGSIIAEQSKTWMLERGEWRATAEGDGETVGFHLSSLYSPHGWLGWAAIYKEFLEVKSDPTSMQVFVNTVLGESYTRGGAVMNADALRNRATSWTNQTAPDGAAVVVKTVDVQDDRLECLTLAFGEGEQSWTLDFEIMWGDPGADQGVWDELDSWRVRQYARDDGSKMRAAIMLIDRGGHNSAAVDAYVKPLQSQRVFSLIGRDTISRPGLAMESKAKKAGLRLWLIATHAAKDLLVSRLAVDQDKPGRMHFADWLPLQYFDQLLAEQKTIVRDRRRGRNSVVWQQVGANEAFDLNVYALAALYILRTFINPRVYGDLGALLETVKTGSEPEQRRPFRRIRQKGFRT